MINGFGIIQIEDRGSRIIVRRNKIHQVFTRNRAGENKNIRRLGLIENTGLLQLIVPARGLGYCNYFAFIRQRRR